MSGILEHFKKGTFEEEYWIPAHNDRRESTLFGKNKLFVRDGCGAPCWVCGVTDKLKLEVHHVFEWAFWNAMDPNKVTNVLQAIEFYDPEYVNSAKDPGKLEDELVRVAGVKPILDTPDDLRNLVVLCVEHHRLLHTGVHVLSFPLWLAMSAVPTGGGVLTREQLLTAVQRVSKIDEELAAFAANNYQPHRN
jgi:hypothetical protein